MARGVVYVAIPPMNRSAYLVGGLLVAVIVAVAATVLRSSSFRARMGGDPPPPSSSAGACISQGYACVDAKGVESSCCPGNYCFKWTEIHGSTVINKSRCDPDPRTKCCVLSGQPPGMGTEGYCQYSTQDCPRDYRTDKVYGNESDCKAKCEQRL